MLSFGCVRQILGGLQRTDLSEGTRMLTSLVYLGVGAWLVTSGYGLVGLAFANLVAESAGIALGWYWCRRVCPSLVISPLCATRRGVREVFALGGRFQSLYMLNYACNGDWTRESYMYLTTESDQTHNSNDKPILPRAQSSPGGRGI